jgi:DNA-directed RNA polymerase subunit RPC12/RpoP
LSSLSLVPPPSDGSFSSSSSSFGPAPSTPLCATCQGSFETTDPILCSACGQNVHFDCSFEVQAIDLEWAYPDLKEDDVPNHCIQCHTHYEHLMVSDNIQLVFVILCVI